VKRINVSNNNNLTKRSGDILLDLVRKNGKVNEIVLKGIKLKHSDKLEFSNLFKECNVKF